MEFIMLTFTEIPLVRFAHLYETHQPDKYDILPHSQFVEITLVEKGSISMRNNNTGVIRTYSEGDIYSTPHLDYSVETTSNFHRHITFAMTPTTVSGIMSAKEVLDITESSLNKEYVYAILPFMFNNADTASIALKIKKIVDSFNGSEAFKSVHCSAMLMEILSIATSKSIEMAQQEVLGIRKFNHPVYCQQAMQYINAHVSEPINVEAIAESMNVSYGHLSRLFKKQTGLTLIEYINKEKVRRMEELLWSKRLSVSEVAQGVGIADEKYASRLFHKYTGLTIGSYIKLYRK